jgi:hypothetical protein
MGKTMAELNVQKSRYLKVADLVTATNQPWAKAQMPVEIVSAEIGEYPGDGNSPPEDAYLVYFDEFPKPFGMNLTCRKVIQGICGDEAQWRSEDLAGVKLILFAEGTSMGEGLRIRYNAEAAAEDRDQDAPPVDDEPGF